MKITSDIIKKAAGLETENIGCDNLGLTAYTHLPNMLTFLDSEKFIAQCESNPNVKAVLLTESINKKYSAKNITRIICEDPRFSFYTLLNYVLESEYKKSPNNIDKSAKIHPSASIAEYNVTIGKNTVIDPNVTILPDVHIGDSCYIMPGAVLGSVGFEYKRTSKGVLPVFHDGKVIIHDYVEIGANTCIDKGFSFRDTVISEYSKIDNLVHVAHSVHIGKACFVIAGAMIAGTVTLKDNVWIGPHANIAPQVTIGNNAFVTIGAVVTKDVGDNEMVSGVFAVPHKKFLENLKKSLE